ncbi:hypothetical protein VaNZ11_013994 [Volvox africanus]|uniref:Uncharacterized protein n=1 Tax=Volvox africanus TaxID=51714 RepID=A0ABQ5SHG3_9CHLO|nr:hypothetical protein VaNZ11_013994 [Volvox africanus]
MAWAALLGVLVCLASLSRVNGQGTLSSVPSSPASPPPPAPEIPLHKRVYFILGLTGLCVGTALLASAFLMIYFVNRQKKQQVRQNMMFISSDDPEAVAHRPAALSYQSVSSPGLLTAATPYKLVTPPHKGSVAPYQQQQPEPF